MVATTEALAVLRAWLDQHPRYAYTAKAVERTADGASTTATLHILYDAAQHVETIHVVQGHMAGTDVRWAGGATADVRGPGLAHVVSMRMPLRDAHLLSPRGNDARVGVFSNVERCFEADAPHVVSETSGTTLTLIDTAPSCRDGYGPAPVTTDRLTLEASDGQPIERERLVGDVVVERWVISELRT